MRKIYVTIIAKFHEIVFQGIGNSFFVTKNRQKDRRRLACIRLYSTANDGGFALYRFIGCCWRLAAEAVAFL
ncbi:MAG: hypothetical protein LBP59_19905 [Planctomycetaceae bacterium]|nr:hypothetical protein [Planctomycetaceae bacterium]